MIDCITITELNIIGSNIGGDSANDNAGSIDAITARMS